LLVDGDLSNLKEILDDELTKGNSNFFLILRNSHVEDLDFVSAALALSWDRPALGGLEVMLVINSNLGLLSHDIRFHVGKITSYRSLIVLGRNGNFEVVEILSRVNLEPRLVCFKGNSVEYSSTEHHLRARHKVIHAILKSWKKGFLVDYVEENSLISSHLDSNIASDEVNLSSHFLESVILLPEASLRIDFKEKNGAGRSHDQSLIEEQVHRAQV